MDSSSFLKALILGLVEGATEFIPVSSTGHLIIVADWLGATDDRWKAFEVFIQLGAILAIAWIYRERLMNAVLTWQKNPSSRRFFVNLGIAFLPAAIVGVLTYDWIKANLFNPFTVSMALVAGGIAILIVERWVGERGHTVDRVEEMSYGKGLGIGLAQVLSLFPGVSRSGATIMGAYSLGLSRQAAAEFSFFLAIPVMVAASAFDIFESLDVLTLADVPVFAGGFIMAFISALVVVKAFVAFVSRSSFVSFAWYRIVFGITLLAFYFLSN